MTISQLPERDIDQARIDQLGRSSRQAAIVSLLGFLLVIGALGYSALNLRRLERERVTLQRDVVALTADLDRVKQETSRQLRMQESVLDFLGGVASKERIRLVDPTVDWDRTKREIVSMEPGARKSAILAALLLAWKELPFSLQNRGLSQGLDSPHFMAVVLSSVGVQVRQNPGERLSDAMMRTFERVETPLPGDLIFYRGNVGSFVVMYIAPGKAGGKGVAVGTLQTGEEVQVMDTYNMNTPVYPFIGYFRVPYRE